MLRYVERNALRANLCERAEEWRWGSLWRRVHGTPEQRSLLSDWPVSRPRQWIEHANRPQSDTEANAIRQCVARGKPFGSPIWARQTAIDLGLESTLRSRGRPRKPIDE